MLEYFFHRGFTWPRAKLKSNERRDWESGQRALLRKDGPQTMPFGRNGSDGCGMACGAESGDSFSKPGNQEAPAVFWGTASSDLETSSTSHVACLFSLSVVHSHSLQMMDWLVYFIFW